LDQCQFALPRQRQITEDFRVPDTRAAAFEPIAFIGAGTMGLPMLRNLARAGVAVTAFDARPETVAAIAAEGIAASLTLAAALATARVAITMLPDTPDVRAVVLGDGGLCGLMPPGALVIDMSTIAAAAATEIGARLGERGIAFLDAPVSGGVSGAINGTLSIMVGGEADALRRAEPILGRMGKTILHAGPCGMGQVFKACNQLMVASHIQAMCEALALARAHGADAERLVEALRKGAAGSWMLDNLAPKVLARDASAGFRIDLQLKDLKLAGDAAFAKGVPLPGLALATALYLEARAHGEGGNGNQALFRTYDRMTDQAG
jgi:2-hydroxy-3-oxopropionate reductase